LNDQEAQWLKRAAEVTGRTKSDLMREAVRKLAIEKIPVEEDPLWQLIGLGGEDSSSPGDLSINHDKYLVQFQMEDDGKLPRSQPPDQ